ncbi:MAG: ATP synthase F1 subunit gamma [Lachnospiraceae bacterium]|jgi:F-type H+-transporting ATPase subunit gamma|nr:ATP synthase F1 subunit gamma [Lachnospiraceae bacterium]
MASMKDIKQRKSSIQSTQQITKAMKLVSTVKLQKAKTRAENANPFFNHVYNTVSSILAKSKDINHPYLKPGDSDRIAVVVITSNRGLAGGYNSNVVKLITESGFDKDKVDIYAIGGKGRDSLDHKGYHVVSDDSPIMEAPTYEDAKAVCDKVLESFVKGEISEIYLAYAHFKNTVVNVPTLMKLLPVDMEAEEVEETKASAPMGFEPNEEEVLEMVIPKYITSLFYGALMEAVASENGARMQAMDSATSNAEEMISDLSLKYNRARQGAITQELTEIIAGAQAIS